MLLRLIAWLLFCGFARSLCAQTPSAGHKPILPIGPAELLAFMPTPPKGWELKQSKANENFVQWLTDEAFREYSYTPPPANADATPAPPLITRIRIMDTGYWPAMTGDFEDFKPEKQGTSEKLMMNGFQAIRMSLGTAGERLRISVKRRFVVQVDALNQHANAAVSWAKTIDLAKLSLLPDASPDKLPKPIVLNFIDEINPSKNMTSKLQWMSDEEMEAAAKKP